MHRHGLAPAAEARGLLPMAATLVVCLSAWAQEAASPPAFQPHAPAPADASEMAARLAALPAAVTGIELLGTPVVWEQSTAIGQVPALAPIIDRYELQWGVSARVSLPAKPALADIAVLCLADSLQAFGVFIGLQVSDGVPAALGQGAQWAEDRLLIWQGPYVVVIRANAPRVRVEAQVLALARALSAQLPLPDERPLLLRLMPAVRMQRFTLVYWPRQVPDVPTLSQALSARYVGEVGGARLVLADLGDEMAARACYRQLLRELDPSGLHWPLPGLGGQNAVITDDRRDMAAVLQEGQYVAATLEVTDRALAEALLRITLTHIHIIQR